MFSQAYWHHVVRTQKAMLLRTIEAFLAQFKNDRELNKFKSNFLIMVTSLLESLYRSSETLTLFPLHDKKVNEFELTSIGTGTDLAPTDAAVLAWFYENLLRWNRPEKSLIKGILKRKLYKRLWVISYEYEQIRWQKIVDLWDKSNRYKRHKVSIEFEKAISEQVSLKEQNH